MEYPCKEDHHNTTTQECFYCEKSQSCDVYASMLDEDTLDYHELLEEEYR